MLNVNFEAMDLRAEIENIVHEILMEGVTKEDAVKELWNLHSVSQQRELLSDYNNFINNECVLAGGILTEFEIKKFQERNCG